MESYIDMAPVAIDHCDIDGSRPCWYYHAKLRALNGGRASLSIHELDLLGCIPTPAPTDGWRTPNLPSADAATDAGAPVAEGWRNLLLATVRPTR